MLTPPTLTVPWWVWLLGGAAAVGGGFLAYKAWQRSREERNAVLGVLPQVLSPYSAIAARHEAPAPAIGRDPGACGCASCGGHG